MSHLKLKICGMRSPRNIEEIAASSPDYMGFIFHSESKRFVGKDFDPAHLNLLSPETKAVGVFVNEFVPRVRDRVDYYHLDCVQLHGDESPEYCRKLRQDLPDIEIIKAIAIPEKSDTPLDIELLKKYEGIVNYFLFDTKGSQKGGNGTTFNWGVLSSYTLATPFFLSGGITVELLPKVREFAERNKHCFAVDNNSRFETEPCVKSPPLVCQFAQELRG